MESPTTWSLLTAALSVSNLREPEETWSFLLWLQAARNGAGHYARFKDAVERERDREITGPSKASRIAAHMHPDLVGLRGGTPDPNGDMARSMRKAWLAGARKPTTAGVELAAFDEIYCTQCGSLEKVRFTIGEQRTLAPCAACNGALIGPLTLLVELGLASSTARICPRCGSSNVFDAYCYRCGMSQES